MVSELEASFELWLRTEGVGRFVREFTFHQGRKWRFDFAWPYAKVAVEIDGFGPAGAHRTRQAALSEYEKLEVALRLGWRVYRVPGAWIRQGQREIWRPEVMETLKWLLGSVNN